jgi:gamma-glutamyl:cysteine ligase YbdK (ATP-grasp superfamily)
MAALGLFEGYGIEIEYMIVDGESLDVRPICDELIQTVAGDTVSEVERGDIAWSNELALHVLELKTNGPSPTIADLGEKFQAEVRFANERLEALGARLLPTAMHPWMDPASEVELWPHEFNEVYRTFDRIFGCSGHGWGNLQSTHINLPFADDGEFARLHAAIRLVLPLIPALAASSPIADGSPSGVLDARLRYYATNCARQPSVTGVVVPEPVYSIDEYHRLILEQIYQDLAPLDRAGVLRHEWVNARGAIARFDRMALEIRVVDTQECPAADIAVATAISACVRALVEETWCDLREQREWDHRALAVILDRAVEAGGDAVLSDRRFLRCFRFPESGKARMGDLWQHIIEISAGHESWPTGSRHALGTILGHGCLARRILAATREASLREIYGSLAECLDRGESFVP